MSMVLGQRKPVVKQVSAGSVSDFPTLLVVDNYNYHGENISMDARLLCITNGTGIYTVKRSDRGSIMEVAVSAKLLKERGVDAVANYLLREHLFQYV